MQGMLIKENSRGCAVVVRDINAPVVLSDGEYSFFGELAYVGKVLYGTVMQFWYDVARGEIILQ